MATLLGKKINATYDSLLKTEDNDGITSSLKQITDGVGQTTPLYLSTTEAKIGGNLEITGDLTVGGTTTYVNTDNVTVKDGLVLLANNNTSDILDIGLYGKYNDGAVKYTGIYRDASDGVFKIFDGLTTEPTTTVGGGNLADFSAAGGSFTGNLTVSSAITAGYLTVADGVFHDGDTDTKIEFLANQIKTTTGGVLNINVVPTATTFYQNVFVDGNYYSTDGNISLTNGDIVTGGHIAINSGNAATSFSSNANQLIVGGVDSLTHQGLTIGSDSGATGNIFFADGITGDEQYRGLITYNHSSDTMYLGTAGANRVSIASDGTFTKLGSIGNIELNDGGYRIDFSQQGIIRSSGVGAYLSLIANGNINFSTDAGLTNHMKIDTSGNVGIGVSPIDKVHAAGGFTSTGLSVPSNTSIGSVQLGYDGTNGVLRTWNSSPIQLSTYGHIQFDTSGSERMRIDSSGRVGIGVTPSADSKLTVYNSSGNAYIQSYTPNGVAYFGSISSGDASIESNGDIRFTTGATYSERMRIDSSGNTIVRSGNELRINRADNATYASFSYAQGTGLAINDQNADGIRFLQTGTERMRITSAGILLVNQQTPDNTSDGFGVYPTGSSGGTMVACYNGDDGIALTVGRNSSGAAVYFYTGTSNVGNISVSPTSTAYNTSSDYRLKEDWQPMADALTRIDALKPVNFAWKSSGERVDGFLAHELQEVIPEAVTGEKDEMEEYEETPAQYETVIVTPAQEAVYETIEHAEELDADGNVITEAWTEQVLVSEAVEEVTEQVLVSEAVMGTRPKYQGIDQSKIVPLLTAGLQEAHEMIKQLQAEIAALKA